MHSSNHSSTSSAMFVNGQLLLPSGTRAKPAIAYQAQPGMGQYLSDPTGFPALVDAAANTDLLTVDGGALGTLVNAGQLLLQNGSLAAPALGFLGGSEGIARIGSTLRLVSNSGKGTLTAGTMVSPAALATGTTSNWVVAYNTGATVRATPAAVTGSSVGGITVIANELPNFTALLNVGTTSLTLLHEDTGSTAAHRFALVGGGSMVIAAGAGVTLAYDATSLRWRAW